MARKPINSAETIRRINEKNSNKPPKKTAWKDLPERVRLNILRVREAEQQRKETGGNYLQRFSCLAAKYHQNKRIIGDRPRFL